MSSNLTTTATQKEAKPALVPKLRFPEFHGAEGWKMTPLERCLDYQQPTPYLVKDERYNPAFKTPVLTAGKTFILGNTNEEHGIFTDGLPVIIFDDFTTATQFVDFPFKAKSSAMKILQAKNGADIKFMFEALQNLSFEVGAHERHWISTFAPMLVPVPSPDEQNKIAECLSSVDELIAAQIQKVDALKIHKKGLMQQLFPREGETQPRLRFPEFQNAGEWEEEELGSKTKKVGSGITPTGGDKTYKLSGRPFVRSQNVGWGVLLLDDVAFIDEETHSSFSGTELQVLDVLLNITGASIGRSAIADARIAGGNVNQHVCIIRVKSAELNPFYVNQYLISPGGQKQIDSFQAGGNRQGLNFAQIRSFSIPLPPKLPEQQRIADCLTSLDDLIAEQTQKHEALKTHKKGLMQQLFPSPEGPNP
jgi:type I restriction enzyme S subunit